jgi:Zn-dependent protease with chaperone function
MENKKCTTDFWRKIVALSLCEVLIMLPLSTSVAQSPAPPVQKEPLRSYLQRSYLELFELAPTLHFSTDEIRKQRESFSKGEDSCVDRFKDHVKRYDKQLDNARSELKKATAQMSTDQRKTAHCNIQNLDLLKSEAAVLATQAIPTAYDNLSAKLDVIEKWPTLYQQTQQEIVSKAYLKRQWADVSDIGFREIVRGQEDDIKRGQQAIEELKRAHLLPPEVEDKAIQDYVNTVAQRIARKSDLRVPLHVVVLQSKEINAFALPGGYLFINRGLLEAADDESELAGVLAHEMSHVVARHSQKLMKRATIAGIFYQAAQVAAIVLTGGVAGIGLSYALQYGFYGLGMALDLKLLGVSRDYELEADQLGVQYAWNAGYDPTGFTRFFDKMATKEGYVNGVSWFRTHPAFYQRMVETQREMLFLPHKADLIMQTSAFEDMKLKLAPITATAEKEEAKRPSLLMTREEGCESPKKVEYKPGQTIEELCATAKTTELATRSDRWSTEPGSGSTFESSCFQSQQMIQSSTEKGDPHKH